MDLYSKQKGLSGLLIILLSTLFLVTIFAFWYFKTNDNFYFVAKLLPTPVTKALNLRTHKSKVTDQFIQKYNEVALSNNEVSKNVDKLRSELDDYLKITVQQKDQAEDYAGVVRDLDSFLVKIQKLKKDEQNYQTKSKELRNETEKITDKKVQQSAYKVINLIDTLNSYNYKILENMDKLVKSDRVVHQSFAKGKPVSSFPTVSNQFFPIDQKVYDFTVQEYQQAKNEFNQTAIVLDG